MVKAIQRLKDENTSGGEIVETDGNTTVYANDRLVSVNTSLVGEFIEDGNITDIQKIQWVPQKNAHIIKILIPKQLFIEEEFNEN